MTLPLVSILDDEPEIRAMLVKALEDAGFRTISFSRATEFEAALQTATPDVCLVDLSLPDRDGLTLVHRLALEQGQIGGCSWVLRFLGNRITYVLAQYLSVAF